jgi:hypothetical protein
MAKQISATNINLSDKDILTGLTQDTTALYSTDTNQTLVSGALRIHGGSASALAQINATYYGVANKVLVTKASATDMAALVGTVANATFNVYCFFIDSAGVLSSAMGTAGATLAAVLFPAIPTTKACIGFVIINPTGTGGFVGGTTALDDATVVPNAVFINTLGGFNPNAAAVVVA